MTTNSEQTEVKNAWVTEILSASTEGFTGELQIRYRKVNNELTIQLEQYRINKGGNSGGNSANIDFTAAGSQGGKFEYDSPDNLIQDGTWKTYNKQGVINVGSSTNAKFSALFIFDKSGGADPRRTGEKTVYF
jgi:hypothetical protein